ncbi:MAG: pyrimidine 5'-nucleotidase [Anaerolineaceae bacterium]|jgi:pyrimidine 5'-nucleotidase
MSLKTMFLDLDDTLYPPSAGIWSAIGVRIDLFMVERLHLPAGQVPALRRQLFSQYGTTLRGLVVTMNIDPVDYLDFVHDVPVERMLQPDARLREILTGLLPRKVILTNADRKHAGRVLDALKVTDCVDQIIDILDITPYCKPQAGAFECALRMAGEEDPAQCALIDDGLPNLATARQLGFHTVRVGSPEPSQEYEVGISSIHELPGALDALF